MLRDGPEDNGSGVCVGSGDWLYRGAVLVLLFQEVWHALRTPGATTPPKRA